MREANIVIHKPMCEEQHVHNERVSEHQAWNIKHGLFIILLLRALLLDSNQNQCLVR
jgi:hypothetical protein